MDSYNPLFATVPTFLKSAMATFTATPGLGVISEVTSELAHETGGLRVLGGRHKQKRLALP